MANSDSERDKEGENRELNRGLLVIPKRRGTETTSVDGKIEANIRFATLPMVGSRIIIDFFDPTIEDGDDAHIESKFFKWTDEGAGKATIYLQKKGFKVVVETESRTVETT